MCWGAGRQLQPNTQASHWTQRRGISNKRVRGLFQSRVKWHGLSEYPCSILPTRATLSDQRLDLRHLTIPLLMSLRILPAATCSFRKEGQIPSETSFWHCFCRHIQTAALEWSGHLATLAPLYRRASAYILKPPTEIGINKPLNRVHRSYYT